MIQNEMKTEKENKPAWNLLESVTKNLIEDTRFLRVKCCKTHLALDIDAFRC